MSKNALIVFARNPVAGKVKTRLAREIGNELALKIYTFLLEHTESTIRELKCDKAVFYSEEKNKNDIWDDRIYQKYVQSGADFGERMMHSFHTLFQKDYEKVIIIGSDLYHLKAEILEDAFLQLNHHDVVVGPAADGGYYLLGMRQLYSELFFNKKWSTSSVLSDTLFDLQNHSVYLLEKLNDIDTYDDLKYIPELKQLINNESKD